MNISNEDTHINCSNYRNYHWYFPTNIFQITINSETVVLSILLGIFVGFIVYLIVSFYNKRKN